jgi:hypothetical protein
MLAAWRAVKLDRSWADEKAEYSAVMLAGQSGRQRVAKKAACSAAKRVH